MFTGQTLDLLESKMQKGSKDEYHSHAGSSWAC